MGHKGLSSTVYADYAIKAKKRGLVFAISKTEFALLIQKNCYICGAKPSNRKKSRELVYLYNGLDRVNSSEGYILGNVMPCCFMCNQIKSNRDLRELTKHLKRMVKGLRGMK